MIYFKVIDIKHQGLRAVSEFFVHPTNEACESATEPLLPELPATGKPETSVNSKPKLPPTVLEIKTKEPESSSSKSKHCSF